VTLAHWDDVEVQEIPDVVRPLGGRWQSLGDAAGSVGVGAKRVALAPGQLMTPPHVHTAEEEIFFVLDGSATLWQGGRTCAVGVGDTIVHPVRGEPHTLIAGDDGLEVLVFGLRVRGEHGFLPRTGSIWVEQQAVTRMPEHPWESEAKLGLPEGEPGERPANVVALEQVEGAYGGRSKRLAAAGGAQKSGLNWLSLHAGEDGAPPHCHSADEEVFVVLDGEGVLELWAPPRPDEPVQSEPAETHSVRRGSVVARPPGTRISHSFRAGETGLTFLAYGTREPNDICWYPRSNKIFLRGLGVVARLDLLEYSDGEPD
jgi:uncharacterized cupin superfamily protein